MIFTFKNVILPKVCKRLIFILLLSLIWFNKGLNAQQFVWAKSMGGSSFEGGQATAIDKWENIYITGFFEDTVDFDPSGETSILVSKGERDIFLAKYDSLGNFIWAINIGGGSDDYAYDIAVDVEGNIFISGVFEGTVDFNPSTSSYNLSSSGRFDNIFLAKYNTSGNLLWARAISANYPEIRASIAIDTNSNVYITGYFYRTTDFNPSSNAGVLTASTGSDIFLAKYNSTGSYLWAHNIGGTSSGRASAVTLDRKGNVFITGNFQGVVDFDPSSGTANLSETGGTDAFLAKYDSFGNYIWALNMGGVSSSFNYGSSVTVDNDGNACITGTFQGSTDFNPGPRSAILYSSGGVNSFLAKYDGSGNYLWVNNLGRLYTTPNSIVTDGNGDILVTGYFAGTNDFDPYSNTVNLTSDGDSDGFLAKYNGFGNYIWAGNVGGVSRAISTSIVINNTGKIIISGSYWGSADLDPTASVQNLTSTGFSDIFLAKYFDTTFVAVIGDSSFSMVSNSGWALSTVTSTATANSYPWPGVMSTPAKATFTLPVDVGQPYRWEHLWKVPGSQVITSLSGVTYYRNTFELADPTGIEVRLRMYVDDNMQIFINGKWVALEVKMGPNVWRGLGRDLLFKDDGTVDNGHSGGEPFTFITSVAMDSILQTGTNEIILAIRNRTSKPDIGGFSFRMDLDKGAVKKASSVAASSSVANANNKLIIFPNPTSGNVTVALNLSSETTTKGNVVVFDFSGKQVLSETIYSVAELNLNSQPAGVYLIKVTSGAETFNQKVVKQ